MRHEQPTPPFSWDDAPGFLNNGAEFGALDMPVQRYVLEHWLWCKRNGQIHGHGLVTHHNWLKFQFAEVEAAGGREILSGVTLNGHTTYREEW